MTKVHHLNSKPKLNQLDLFGYQRPAFHKYCWLDISEINQSRLLHWAHKFETTHIFDTRLFPVFRRPKFHIDELLNAFEKSDVSYISLIENDWRIFFEATKNQIRMASVIRSKLNLIFIYENNEENIYLKEYKGMLNSFEDTQEAILTL